MNIGEIASEIRFYTGGYPYLVSRICLLIETKLDRNWTTEGIQEALKIMLEENTTLFDDLFKKIEENQGLSELLFDLTVGKIKYQYNAHDPTIKFGLMFCFVAKEESRLVVHNKIFEIAITNYFVSKITRKWRENNIIQTAVNGIIKNGYFNMELCLNMFKRHYSEIYTDQDLKFLERNGKLIFLTYIMPFINGNGFYHFEPQTRDYGKIDLVIDYLKQQFILELKIWYGDSRHEEAYDQLVSYLKSKNKDEGYLLTFDFRKKGDKKFSENKWIEWEGKRIFDVVLRVGKEPVSRRQIRAKK